MVLTYKSNYLKAGHGFSAIIGASPLNESPTLSEIFITWDISSIQNL